MATLTKTAPKQKTAPAPAPDVETKEESTVVADARLGKMLKDYTQSERTTQGYWLKIVEYVKDNKTSRETLKATLIEYRKVQENTASVEATMILNAAKPEHEDQLQQAIDGEITVREFRKGIMRKREDKPEEDNEHKLELRLRQVARFAIEKADISDPKEFRKLAFEIFTNVLEKYTEAPEEAQAESEADEAESSEDEEE